MPHDAPSESASHIADLELIEESARAAGQVALSHFRTAVEQWEKPGNAGPVSAADLAVNAVLHERLRKARPGYGWLSEEDDDSHDRLRTSRVFVVDPIDGTRAFLEGKEGFSVCVAVVEHGMPTAAVVHLPARQETYTAVIGRGAHLNGTRLSASKRTGLDGATMLINSSHLKPEFWPGGVPPVERHFRSSLAWRLCLVASGRFDTLATMRVAHEWDVASGVLIAGEAGALVTGRSGEKITLNDPEPRVPGLIVAPPALHAALLKRR